MEEGVWWGSQERRLESSQQAASVLSSSTTQRSLRLVDQPRFFQLNQTWGPAPLHSLPLLSILTREVSQAPLWSMFPTTYKMVHAARELGLQFSGGWERFNSSVWCDTVGCAPTLLHQLYVLLYSQIIQPGTRQQPTFWLLFTHLHSHSRLVMCCVSTTPDNDSLRSCISHSTAEGEVSSLHQV